MQQSQQTSEICHMLQLVAVAIIRIGFYIGIGIGIGIGIVIGIGVVAATIWHIVYGIVRV